MRGYISYKIGNKVGQVGLRVCLQATGSSPLNLHNRIRKKIPYSVEGWYLWVLKFASHCQKKAFLYNECFDLNSNSLIVTENLLGFCRNFQIKLILMPCLKYKLTYVQYFLQWFFALCYCKLVQVNSNNVPRSHDKFIVD
jgi:hypothetical protein